MENNLKLLMAALAAATYIALQSLPSLGTALASEAALSVTRVIDGDTLKLSNGKTVRLIGVDTPEVHYSEKLLKDSRRSHKEMKAIQALGRKASEFTKDLCLGNNVRVEFDVVKKDKYKRLLAYVYLEDGTFVNAKIIEEGYGQVMTIPPNVKHADYFLKLQREAREKNKGLWGS